MNSTLRLFRPSRTRINQFKKFKTGSCITAAHLSTSTPHQKAPTAELTSIRYNVSRKNFKKLDQNDKNFFKTIIDNPDNNILENDLDKYNVDWLNTVRGDSRMVLRPSNTEQISEIVKYWIWGKQTFANFISVSRGQNNFKIFIFLAAK